MCCQRRRNRWRRILPRDLWHMRRRANQLAQSGAVRLAAFYPARRATDYSISGVDVHVFKAPSTFFNLKSWLELHAGAHYYAHGFYDTRWQRAKATVKLPSSAELQAKGERGNRIPCFSLAVSGVLGSTDFAVEWEQKGPGPTDGCWKAFAYSQAVPDWSEPRDCIYPINTTTTVDLTVEVQFGVSNDPTIGGRQADTITAKYIFRDAQGNALQNTRDIVLTKPGYFACPNPRDLSASCLVRFTRFISFLHGGGGNDALTDYADQTKLVGSLTNLALLPRNSGNYVPWTRDKLQMVWAVQKQNILKIDIGDSSPVTDTVWYKHQFRYL